MDFSLYVERLPAIKGPARRRTTITVPGRNGDLHIDEGTFENYTQPYACYFHGEGATPEVAHLIKAWLSKSGEYRRLEDTYDPEYFRLATFAGPLDVENKLNKYGRCTINFDCAPQCFLKSGEEVISLGYSGEISNPTAFSALPLITVYGGFAGSLTIGGVTVEIKSIVDQVTLDCEMQDAYRQVADGGPENYNGKIYAPEFPVLQPGKNAVSWAGGITGVDIIPRWWTL